VRVFLDECVDWRLSRELKGHDVKTARQMEWTTLRNGELLSLAAAQFDVFLTVDRNLSFQQNLGALPMVVLVLHASSNRLSDLKLLVPDLLKAIETARPGRATVVGG
jgi:Domain of unknown function (DUF5615)